MTAHQLKVHVKNPGTRNRTHGYVTIRPVATDLGRSWDVYEEEKLVGTIRRRQHTPHTKLPGTRIRKDLAPRVVWDAYRASDRTESLTHERRNDALFYIIKER